jgi:hypothetical protein
MLPGNPAKSPCRTSAALPDGPIRRTVADSFLAEFLPTDGMAVPRIKKPAVARKSRQGTVSVREPRMVRISRSCPFIRVTAMPSVGINQHDVAAQRRTLGCPSCLSAEKTGWKAIPRFAERKVID